MRSCSAPEAAAGSPVPPIARQVARLNWYLPRYWPSADTAVGFPPDSHCAMRAAGEGRRGGVRAPWGSGRRLRDAAQPDRRARLGAADAVDHQPVAELE